jgi:hypothetical protein
MDKDAREARDRKIFDLWLADWTLEEVASATNASKSDVDRLVSSFSQNGGSAVLGKTQQAAAEHATDFTPPIYNVWKQQEKTEGSSHFGNSEVRWLDNLLYMYTKPFDMVVDPFGGPRGSTSSRPSVLGLQQVAPRRTSTGRSCSTNPVGSILHARKATLS